jgi:WD40 repeat protein
LTLKVSRKFPGHVSEVTSICNDAVAPNLIATASADASIKLWDIREANQVRTFKGHVGQVNAVKLSPDGHWIASAGNDRIVQVRHTYQIWDIMSGDSLKKFDTHTAPVTSLLFNPRELKLASAGLDKRTILWDLETMTEESMTKQEATPIEAVSFDTEGKFLFTASNESLKVWKIDAGCRLLNSVPTKWKGVKDLMVSSDNKFVLGLSAGPKAFTSWNIDFMKAPASPISGPDDESYDTRNAAQRNPPRRVLSRDNIPNEDMPASVLAESGNEKFNLMEGFGEIRREHKKFCQAMEQKQNNLSPIFHWLSSGNNKAAVNAIEQKNDPMVLVDLINMVINTKKVDTMSIEFATALLRKAALLAESNYIIHIKTGMSFVSLCIAKFKTVVMWLLRISSL